MPEHDNDRLEQFFRKAAGQPDVPFDERDWRKLEARLDAENLMTARAKKSQTNLAVTTGLLLLLLFSGALWMNYLYDFIPVRGHVVESTDIGKKDDNRHMQADEYPDTQAKERAVKQDGTGTAATGSIPVSEQGSVRVSEAHQRSVETQEPDRAAVTLSAVEELDGTRILSDLGGQSSDIRKRNKQKASVELPGAEEVTTSAAEPEANRKQASDPERHHGAPRLSLLLSFAPDFSGTSLSRYSAPGKAFGAMVYYHFTNRWSVSTGVVKNNKQYSGNGEDYDPPYGYWKYNTNGKIPSSVNGACTVLEFPVMVSYSLREGGKNSWRASGGVSSYLMLDESYQYIFDEPNPGAKDGWNSRGSSHFLFNMVNVSLAYEHEVLPGFRVGVEPYVKIPISKIGWSNLKLFSSGASLTLRYVLVRQKNRHLHMPGRGPD